MESINLARYIWPDRFEGRLPLTAMALNPYWVGCGLEAYWSLANPLVNLSSGIGVNAASANGLSSVVTSNGLAASGFSSPGNSNRLVRFNDISGFTSGQEKTLYCVGTLANASDTSVLVSIGTAGQGVKLSTNGGNWTVTYFGVADYSFGIAAVSQASFSVACSIKGSTATLALVQNGTLKIKSVSVGTPITTTVPLVLGSVGSSAATDVCTGTIALGGSFNRALTTAELVSLVTGEIRQLVAEPIALPFYLQAAAGGLVLQDNSVTTVTGSLTPALSLSVAGNQATTSVGSFSTSISFSLQGNQITSSVGVLESAITLSLSGNGMTASAGTLSPVAGGISLTGNAASSGFGTFGVTISTPLSGSLSNASSGDIGVSGGNVTVALSGNQIISSNGSLGLNVLTLSQADIDAIASAVWANILESSFSSGDLLRLIAAMAAGKVSGAHTGTETFRDVSDTKNRIVATVDSQGNRSAITIDAV